jgi:hypothetical protein
MTVAKRFKPPATPPLNDGKASYHLFISDWNRAGYLIKHILRHRDHDLTRKLEIMFYCVFTETKPSRLDVEGSTASREGGSVAGIHLEACT